MKYYLDFYCRELQLLCSAQRKRLIKKAVHYRADKAIRVDIMDVFLKNRLFDIVNKALTFNAVLCRAIHRIKDGLQ